MDLYKGLEERHPLEDCPEPPEKQIAHALQDYINAHPDIFEELRRVCDNWNAGQIRKGA